MACCALVLVGSPAYGDCDCSLLAGNAKIALTGTGSIPVAFPDDANSGTATLDNTTIFLGIACTRDSIPPLELLLPLGFKDHHKPDMFLIFDEFEIAIHI